MPDILFDSINFSGENNWILFIQLITLIPLFWFGVRLFKLFRSEVTHIGGIPTLAVVYTSVSIYYCLRFITNFDDIIIANDNKIRNILDPYENPFYFVGGTRILTSFILVAFTFNFCKSLYILNCLEFGRLNQYKLKDFLSNRKRYVLLEGFLRVIIAALFIYIEKRLGVANEDMLRPVNSDAFFFKENPFMYDLGLQIVFLYFFLIMWLFSLNIYDKRTEPNNERKLAKSWYNLSYIQFATGLIIGGLFMLTGDHYSPEDKYLILIILGFGIAISMVLLFTIIKNECNNLKSGKPELVRT